MSMLKAVQDWLAQYPNMEILPLTDQVQNKPSSYAIAPTGNGTIEKDVTGARMYQNNYMFFAKEAALDEVDKQSNHDLIESLSDWMDSQSDAGNLPTLPGKFVATSITASNGMLLDVDNDGLGQYQIQFQMELYKRSDT